MAAEDGGKHSLVRRAMGSSRHIVLIAVVSTFLASMSLMLYEVAAMFFAVLDALKAGVPSQPLAKKLAVGLIEAVDIFLISIAIYIISLGMYRLFVDETLPTPRWLDMHDLDDLKDVLVSLVIVVLAVLFLREAMARDVGFEMLPFGLAIAVVIAVLIAFLVKKATRRD